MGRSLSRGEHSSVKGQYVPVALETALGNLLLFFLLAEALNARFKEEIRFYVNFHFVQNELFIEDFSK